MIQNVTQLGVAPTIAEVADYLKLHPATIYRRIYEGKLEVLAGFGRLRICPRSLERFLSRTRTHQPRVRLRGRR